VSDFPFSSTDTYPDPIRSIDQREARFFALAFVFLGLTGLALILAPAARTGIWQLTPSRLVPLVVLPVWIGSAWAVRRALRRSKPARDPMLLPLAYLLSGWGTLTIWRLLPSFGARQTAWFLVGTALLVEVFRRPSDLGWLRRYRYLWLSSGILLTGLTLLLGTNPSGGEPHLWLGCCGLYFQPSELLRLLLIVYLASYLGERLSWGSQGRIRWTDLAPLWVISGISVLLVFAQRDLGTGTLFVALLAVVVYAAYGRWRALLSAAALASAGGFLGWLFIGVVRVRIEAWLNPWVDPSGNAYQIVQSLIAIASGGLFGSGPGFGSPGFIPAAHTDFIFSAITEEWGMIGALALIGCVALLVSRGLRAASRAGSPFSVMLAAGVSIGFGLQSLIIIGGVVRLLPLTGVTLPFMSYGGSSLLTSLLGLAFLVHISGGQHAQTRFLPSFLNIQFGFSLGWLALAGTLGWWTIFRAPALVNRTDNPRRALAERSSPRGQIVDRQGELLAETVGDRGDYRRFYPDPSVAPVVGYDSRAYGQAGVEQSMDAYLRGEAGYLPQDVFWHELVQGTPPPGYDVRLTLDRQLQDQAMQALSGWVGAAVVLDPVTGNVLALASSPSFDPNRLDDTWTDLTSSDLSPLLNRASQGDYQPGTAIMPFVLGWAVQTGEIRSGQLAPSVGQGLLVDGRSLGCLASQPGATQVSYADAIRAGCPAPYFHLGESLGIAPLRAMAEKFGFGSRPALRIETAGGGQIASDASGSAGLEAVGQGEMTASPLQMARAFSASVTGGSLPSLQMVEAVRAPGSDWQPLPAVSKGSEALTSSAAAELQSALTSADGQRVEMAGEAISGTGGSRLAWYQGASLTGDPALLAVVVLERGNPDQAQMIGRSLVMSGGATQP
jgi:cell division protein FtsW (lipid II flippase)